MLKNKKIVQLLGNIFLCLVLTGCVEEEFLVQKESFNVILEEESEPAQKEMELEERNLEKQEEKQMTEVSGKESKDKEIVVHICGAVNCPGVYYLKEGQRLFEGIEKAGGFREDACQDYLNQALMLEDGMKIIVPSEEEIAQRENKNLGSMQEESVPTQAADAEERYIMNAYQTEEVAFESGYLQKKDNLEKGVTEEVEKKNQKVDLNTADEALLCTLPGIGESRAKSIITYRKEHGPFQKPEDVMKVSGIKEAAYEKIKDFIIVSTE